MTQQVHKLPLGARSHIQTYRLLTTLWDDMHQPCAAAAAHHYSIQTRCHRVCFLPPRHQLPNCSKNRQSAAKCHPDPPQTTVLCATLIDSKPLVTLPHWSYLVVTTLYSHDPQGLWYSGRWHWHQQHTTKSTRIYSEVETAQNSTYRTEHGQTMDKFII